MRCAILHHDAGNNQKVSGPLLSEGLSWYSNFMNYGLAVLTSNFKAVHFDISYLLFYCENNVIIGLSIINELPCLWMAWFCSLSLACL